MTDMGTKAPEGSKSRVNATWAFNGLLHERLDRGTDSNVKGEMVSRSDSIERRLSEETSEPLSTGDTRQPKERKWHCFRENRQKDSVIKILNVVIVILIVLIITIIPCIVRSAVSGSVEKSNQMCSHANVSVPLVPPCTTGWIGYEGKCYFFSEEERNWTSGQRFCTSYDSSLALIESEREKVFMLRYKGKADHWIGLHKNLSQDWRWADGTEFNNTCSNVMRQSEESSSEEEEGTETAASPIPQDLPEEEEQQGDSSEEPQESHPLPPPVSNEEDLGPEGVCPVTPQQRRQLKRAEQARPTRRSMRLRKQSTADVSLK